MGKPGGSDHVVGLELELEGILNIVKDGYGIVVYEWQEVGAVSDIGERMLAELRRIREALEDGWTKVGHRQECKSAEHDSGW